MTPIERLNKALQRIESANEAALTNRMWLSLVVASVGLYDDGRPLYGEWANYCAPFEQPGLWQHPQEFADFLIWMGQYKPKRIIDVGCCFGFGTKLMQTYMRRFVPDVYVVGVDNRLMVLEPSFVFVLGTCHDMPGEFDLAFIDADHEYASVKTDWEDLRTRTQAVAFHDICCAEIEKNCNGGVPRLWREVRRPMYKAFVRDDDICSFGIGVVYK